MTPLDTMIRLIAARDRKDGAAAFACYERNATVVIEPGKIASGAAVVETFTAATMNLPIDFGVHHVIESGDVALHLGRWTLSLPGGKTISGCTTDILRRQPNGQWLLVVDNAWGTAITDGAST